MQLCCFCVRPKQKKGDAMKYVCEDVPRLIHCFGNEKNKIGVDEVVRMIKASHNHIIPINTHNIEEINNWEDLPIGYKDACWRKLKNSMDVDGLIPVWNINIQNSYEKAIAHAERAIELGGAKAIKLEVLNSELNWSDNEQLIKAAEYLSNKGYEVWPLLAPDENCVDRLVEIGCPMIRLMGSKIASGDGISSKAVEVLKYAKSKYPHVKIMLDGGVGCSADVYRALIYGFDSVLVNSYLFGLQISPSQELSNIVEVKN